MCLTKLQKEEQLFNVKEYVFARTRVILVHYLQCGQKLEKHLMLKGKCLKLSPNVTNFSLEIYTFTKWITTRELLRNSLDSVLQNLFNLTFKAPARSLTRIHHLQEVYPILSSIISRQIQSTSIKHAFSFPSSLFTCLPSYHNYLPYKHKQIAGSHNASTAALQ